MGRHAKSGVVSGGDRQRAWVPVDVTFNPDRPSRPWSLTTYGAESWGRDARGRSRTFATEGAARAFAQANASGPVGFRVFSKEGQHYAEVPMDLERRLQWREHFDRAVKSQEARGGASSPQRGSK